MTLDEIKNILRKKAVIYETGVCEPTNKIGESWIGAVKWKKAGEEMPKDADGNAMSPLASLFTGYLSYVPDAIKGVALCNVFISEKIFEHWRDMNGYFKVQTYDSAEVLEPCSWKNAQIKAFPLQPEQVDNDYPQWDGGMDPEIEKAVIKLEKSAGIDYYRDIKTKNYSTHKVGGYPSYIQSGDWDKRYEFVFQIASDKKAGLNIVDSGNFYFFYSKTLDKWEIQCDFY